MIKRNSVKFENGKNSKYRLSKWKQNMIAIKLEITEKMSKKMLNKNIKHTKKRETDKNNYSNIKRRS